MHISFYDGSYTYSSHSSSYRVPVSSDIRLIDFGGATFSKEHHASIIATRQYRAPEVVLGLEWSYPSDCWSVGCILAELLTGELLFATHSDHEHLCLMEKILDRPIPQWMAHEALRDAREEERRMNNRYHNYHSRRDYYHRNYRRSPSESRNTDSSASTAAADELLNIRTDKLKELTSSKQRRKVREAKTLKEQFYHISPEFTDLIRALLTFDPDQRLTAREALRHSFFA